jgi:hypothetical protein
MSKLLPVMYLQGDTTAGQVKCQSTRCECAVIRVHDVVNFQRSIGYFGSRASGVQLLRTNVGMMVPVTVVDELPVLLVEPCSVPCVHVMFAKLADTLIDSSIESSNVVPVG